MQHTWSLADVRHWVPDFCPVVHSAYLPTFWWVHIPFEAQNILSAVPHIYSNCHRCCCILSLFFGCCPMLMWASRFCQLLQMFLERLGKFQWLAGIRSSIAQLSVQICVPRAVRKRREATGKIARPIETMERAMPGRMVSNWLWIVLNKRQMSAL